VLNVCAKLVTNYPLMVKLVRILMSALNMEYVIKDVKILRVVTSAAVWMVTHCKENLTASWWLGHLNFSSLLSASMAEKLEASIPSPKNTC